MRPRLFERGNRVWSKNLAVLAQASMKLQSLVESIETRVTRLVLPRYLKKTGKNSLEGQVQAELASRGLPPAESIEVLKKEPIAFRHFIRVRQHGSNPPRPPVDAAPIAPENLFYFFKADLML